MSQLEIIEAKKNCDKIKSELKSLMKKIDN